MGFSWKVLDIPRFYGVDLKTNPVDVKEGKSLDSKNVYQNGSGILSKRRGSSIMWDADEAGTVEIDEIGSCTLDSQKVYFKFSDGDFKYGTSLTDAVTVVSPSPAISTTNPIYWAVLDDKLFFVDGTNNLRYFDWNLGDVFDSEIYERPTVILTSSSGAGSFTYLYTVDNGLGESPSSIFLLASLVSTATVRVPANTGPQTLIEGDIVRIYSRADSIAAASKLVATHTWTAGNVTDGYADIVTSAISDEQPQLYPELGVALNKTAPTALDGITVHYGRLVGWKGDNVYNSKVSNPHSWPDDSAQREAFVYGFGLGDGESIKRCISYRESLYVMKPSDIAVFGGIGPDDTGNNAYSFRRLETNGNGCIAGKSAVVIGEQEQTYLVYLSRQGFYATNGDAPVRIGEEIETEIQTLSESDISSSVAFHHKKDGIYVCFVGASNARKGWMLDVRKDKDLMVGWFPWEDIPAKCVHWDDDRYIFGTYNGYCASELADGTNADYADVFIEEITDADVDTVGNTLTVSDSSAFNDFIIIRGVGSATLPAGLDVFENIPLNFTVISSTEIQLLSAGNPIDITTTGSGTFTLVSQAIIEAYYTTAWLKFRSSNQVKKLAKPSILINGLSNTSSLTLTMSSAYDWVDSFSDSKTITISPLTTSGAQAVPKNVAISRRKARAVRYKFANSTLYQNIHLQGIEQQYALIRNRGNYA